LLIETDSDLSDVFIASSFDLPLISTLAPKKGPLTAPGESVSVKGQA
jgi:hypothetical protein